MGMSEKMGGGYIMSNVSEGEERTVHDLFIRHKTVQNMWLTSRSQDVFPSSLILHGCIIIV